MFHQPFSLPPPAPQQDTFRMCFPCFSGATGTYTCMMDTGSSCSPQICVTLSVRLDPNIDCIPMTNLRSPSGHRAQSWCREHRSEHSLLCRDKQPLSTQAPRLSSRPCRGLQRVADELRAQADLPGENIPKAFCNHWESHPAACGQHQGSVPEAKPHRGLRGLR